jgi:hypothetical protein
MRLKIGRIPEMAEAPAEDGWLKLREPPMWVVTSVISLPIGLVLAFIAAVLVIRYTEITTEGLTGAGLIAVYVVTIAVHELIHASINPDRGLSERTTLGFWPSRLTFYVHYEGTRSKRNHMLCLLAPFLLLSVLLFVASHYFGWSSWIPGAVIILNAAVSSADVFNFFITMFGVPNSSQLRNRGWDTYWRPADSSVTSNQPLQPITREDARSG